MLKGLASISIFTGEEALIPKGRRSIYDNNESRTFWSGKYGKMFHRTSKKTRVLGPIVDITSIYFLPLHLDIQRIKRDIRSRKPQIQGASFLFSRPPQADRPPWERRKCAFETLGRTNINCLQKSEKILYSWIKGVGVSRLEVGKLGWYRSFDTGVLEMNVCTGFLDDFLKSTNRLSIE